jgi:hypothetical protein
MKKVTILVTALLVLTLVSLPALGQTAPATWIGGDPASPTAWNDPLNWNLSDGGALGNGGCPGGSNSTFGYDVTVNDSSLTSTMDGSLSDGWYGGAHSWTFDKTGGFTVTGAVYNAPVAINVLNAATYSVSPYYIPYNMAINVVPGGVLNVQGSLNAATATISGGGTVIMAPSTCATPDAAIVITDNSTLVFANNYGGNDINLTGPSTATVDCNSQWAWGINFRASTFNFAGQIVLGDKVDATPQVTFDSSDGAPVTGANILMNGYTNNAGGFTIADQQVFQDCTFKGDGRFIACTSGYCVGPIVTMISHGSTFAPTDTYTPVVASIGRQQADGQMTIYGNLVCGKDAAGHNTQFALSVTGTGQTLGKDYTQFSSLTTGNWGSGSFAGTIASVDTLGSPLANSLGSADLVVNITPGLSKGVHSVSDLGGLNDPFAGQTLTILHCDGTTFAGDATGSFANVKFVGGSATLVYNGNNIQITNIFSNPTLAGDINNDGLVDVADYNIWAANVGKTGATWLQGDLNGDGLVDVADYNIWAANVGKTAATPEPISMIILAIGSGLVALKRKRA